MKHEAFYTFSHPIDTLFTTITSRQFLLEKMKALGHRKVEVDIKKEKGKVTIKTTREVPAEAPGPLSKFVKTWNKMEQTEMWEGNSGGPYECQMIIELDGAPISVQGRVVLDTAGKGCTAHTITEVNSGIPFFGKMLEKFAINTAAESIVEEYDFTEKYCSANKGKT